MSIRRKIKNAMKRVNAIMDSNKIKSGRKEINFDTVTLSISHARSDVEEYELLKTENGARASFYEGFWRYKEDVDREDCLQKRVEGGKELYDEICGILRDCEVVSWDGFNKGNRHALDGSSFIFNAMINGNEIYASGENNYPRKFRDFISAVKALLDREKDNDEK